MKFKLLKIVLVSLFLFFSAFPAQAFNALDVIANEIAWMGTEISYNDEWIELYNNTSFSIDLDGWALKAADGAPEINLSGTVPAKGFYLLERTDDNTVPGTTADQVYKGALGNSGENLQLFDNQDNLIDQLNCSEGWFAGNNSTKQTMERINPNSSGPSPDNWQTSKNPEGTPNAKNSFGAESQPESPTSEISESSEKLSEEVEAIAYPSGIVINEILPSPVGADAEEEWIEIFNSNSFEVNLSGWKISDNAGSTTTYTFPQGIKISSFGFLVLTRPTTKITLNNDGDKVSLFWPNGKLLETISYSKAPRGQSYVRQEGNWYWTAFLTPGSQNAITEREAETKGEISEEEGSKGEAFEGLKRQSVGIANFFPGLRSLSVILLAVFTALFSGGIALVLKTKIKGS